MGRVWGLIPLGCALMGSRVQAVSQDYLERFHPEGKPRLRNFELKELLDKVRSCPACHWPCFSKVPQHLALPQCLEMERRARGAVRRAIQETAEILARAQADETSINLHVRAPPCREAPSRHAPPRRWQTINCGPQVSFYDTMRNEAARRTRLEKEAKAQYGSSRASMWVVARPPSHGARAGMSTERSTSVRRSKRRTTWHPFCCRCVWPRRPRLGVLSHPRSTCSFFYARRDFRFWFCLQLEDPEHLTAEAATAVREACLRDLSVRGNAAHTHTTPPHHHIITPPHARFHIQWLLPGPWQDRLKERAKLIQTW